MEQLTLKDWGRYQSAFEFSVDSDEEMSMFGKAIANNSTATLNLTYETMSFKNIPYAYRSEYKKFFGGRCADDDMVIVPLYKWNGESFPAWNYPVGKSLIPCIYKNGIKKDIRILKQGARGTLQYNRTVNTYKDWGAYAFPIYREVSDDGRSWKYMVSPIHDEALVSFFPKSYHHIEVERGVWEKPEDIGNISKGCLSSVQQIGASALKCVNNLVLITTFGNPDTACLVIDGRFRYMCDENSKEMNYAAYKIYEYFIKYKKINVSKIGFMAVPKYAGKAFVIKQANGTYQVTIY